MAKADKDKMIEAIISLSVEIKGFRADFNKKFDVMDKRLLSINQRLETMNNYLIAMEKIQRLTKLSILDLKNSKTNFLEKSS